MGCSCSKKCTDGDDGAYDGAGTVIPPFAMRL